jgi:hypothetical protein
MDDFVPFQVPFQRIIRMVLEILHVVWQAFTSFSLRQFGILDLISVQSRTSTTKGTKRLLKPHGAILCAFNTLAPRLGIEGTGVAAGDVSCYTVRLESNHIRHLIKFIGSGRLELGCLVNRLGDDGINWYPALVGSIESFDPEDWI